MNISAHQIFPILCLHLVWAPPVIADVLPEPAVPGLRYYYPPEKVQPRVVETDVCIYGGTSGGVAAAIQARRMGKDVVLLAFGKHIGGLTTGGLSHTDGGGSDVCGGIAREFYNQAGQRNFKPSEAEAMFRNMLDEAGVEVHTLCHLDKVKKEGSKIMSIVMEDGLEVKARQFIDATYEGDLMAKAGVSYTWGRESNNTYGETLNGIQRLGSGGHNWPRAIDPYVVPGDPDSGLLPRVVADAGEPGEGDKSIQAYCFRMRLVKGADRLPFPKPSVYDLQQYELLARLFESGADPRPEWTIDTNNHHLFWGAYFIDFVGGNYGWPDGDYLTREKIFQDHANYQIGVMYFLTNSDRVPEQWRAHFSEFGLPHDEYQDTSGWTHELYIREGRRMVSDYVMTQYNCQGRLVPEDSIGLGTYNMDSHHCQMGVLDGRVANEGNVEVSVDPYPIPYRAITPKREECTNLLVPVALSASHIAFGSIRMEPVFMILGQSAATASCLAIDDDVDVQEVVYDKLRERLLADKQILTPPGSEDKPEEQPEDEAFTKEQFRGLVIDDEDAVLEGNWRKSAYSFPRVGKSYHHDNNEAKGKMTARFDAKLKPGRYEVRVGWPVEPNRGNGVPVTIEHAEGKTVVKINQRKEPSIRGLFESVGVYTFDETATVTISNAGTDGVVIADAVHFVPAE